MQHISIRQIPENSSSDLEPLYRDYLVEMIGNKEGDITAHLRTLSKYWAIESHWPYWIYSGGAVAGFCLVRFYPGENGTHDIEQFFVSQKYRRQGIGATTLKQVLQLHPGDWLVRVLKTNETGLLFWRRAIETCIGDEYACRFEQDEGFEMHFFRFCTDRAGTLQPVKSYR